MKNSGHMGWNAVKEQSGSCSGKSMAHEYIMCREAKMSSICFKCRIIAQWNDPRKKCQSVFVKSPKIMHKSYLFELQSICYIFFFCSLYVILVPILFFLLMKKSLPQHPLLGSINLAALSIKRMPMRNLDLEEPQMFIWMTKIQGFLNCAKIHFANRLYFQRQC